MPRYLVERTFANGLGLPVCAEGAAASAEIIRINAEEQVTWLHSYVSADKSTTFCIYDGRARKRSCGRPSETRCRRSHHRVRVLDRKLYF